MNELTPDLLIYAYRTGIFPMADPDDDNAIYWYAPDPRGILPLDDFHVPKSLRRTVRAGRYEVTRDRAFRRVMEACAAPRATGGTWISEEIIDVYTALHERGDAHSVECWDDGELVGGLYGVSLGGAYFGESMFHTARDASKVALVHLVEHLRDRGFVLLDSQFTTSHLSQFGVTEIPRADYERRLQRAVRLPVTW